MALEKKLCVDCGKDHGQVGWIEPYRDGTRVLLISYPKSGTNLLLQYIKGAVHIRPHVARYWNDANPDIDEAICQLKRFPDLAFAHLPYKKIIEEAINHHPTRTLFLYRDPRDVIVSHLHYVERLTKIGGQAFGDGMSLLKRPDPISYLIKETPKRWFFFTPWLERDYIHQFRFEDFITNENATVRKLIEVFRGTNAENRIAELAWNETSVMARNRPEESATFRKGIVGDWRNHFQPHHIQEFEQTCSDLMEKLGYEL